MAEQLWTDERITESVDWLLANSQRQFAATLLRQMRDEYESVIRQLQAGHEFIEADRVRLLDRDVAAQARIADLETELAAAQSDNATLGRCCWIP